MSRQKLPDSTVFTLKTINYIARDALGRTHTEVRRLVSDSYEEEPPIGDIHIYDAVTGLSTHLDPSTLIARQTKMHAPTVPNSKSVPDPNPNAPNSPVKQVDDLGNRIFKNLTLRGTRQSRSPTDFDEYWYSPDLSVFMSRKHQDPIWEQTVNVAEFDRLEPDPSNFAIPADYKVVQVAETEPVKPPPSRMASPGVDILSDTMGVDFGPYMQRVLEATKRSWYPIIPESARPPLNKQGRVGIRFKIYPEGSVREMILEFPSGDVLLDRAAWGGIAGASPYPPLPREFTGPFLELRLGFFYNLDPNNFRTAKCLSVICDK